MHSRIRPMEINPMVRVREDVHVVVVHGVEIEFVEQGQRVLEVHVIVRGAVHDQEARRGG